MQLYDNWFNILKRAWSVRFLGVAAVLSGLEVGLPFAKDYGWFEWLPGGMFAILTSLVVMAAFVARFFVQKNLIEDEFTHTSSAGGISGHPN